MGNQPYGIRQDYWEQLLRTLRSYPEVKTCLLFGSRAKGTYNPGSDVDLAIKGDNINWLFLAKIADRLDDEDFPWPVDILDLEKIKNQALKEHIERVGVPIL